VFRGSGANGRIDQQMASPEGYPDPATEDEIAAERAVPGPLNVIRPDAYGGSSEVCLGNWRLPAVSAAQTGPGRDQLNPLARHRCDRPRAGERCLGYRSARAAGNGLIEADP